MGRHFVQLPLGLCVCLAVGNIALADPKVDQQSLDPTGSAVGCSISPNADHVALLCAKGSRYNVVFDGVAGPKIESLDNTSGTYFNPSSGAGWVGQVPILFSDDGAHWAYCYKDGGDTVIMLDGKELARGPMQPQLLMPLQFSKGGKHFAWAYDNTINMDGKPGPKPRYLPQLFFSPDGSRYAYVGTEFGGNNQWAVVDGRQVNYFGDIDQFAPNNHLISIYRDNSTSTSVFVMDGKPQFKASGIGRVWTSADGKQIAMMLTPNQNGKQALSVNGKVVAGIEVSGVANVYFSPDGKRYAALCSGSGGQFMIIDGKKQDNYQSVPDQVSGDNYQQIQWAYLANGDSNSQPKIPAFTADSSKFIYVASAANRYYLMTEDGEYDDYTGNALGMQPVLSAVGGHYGFIGQTNNGKQAVVVDGKALPVMGQSGVGAQTISCLSFCADGSHFAFIKGYTLYLDGNPVPGGIQGQRYIFSPDGKHIAYYNGQSLMSMDGKLLETAAVSHGGAINPIFSPDSQHLYWLKPDVIPNSKDNTTLYADGKAVAHISYINMGNGPPITYTVSPQGVLTLFARTDGTLTRFTVTPDSNIDAMLAAAKPLPAAN